MPKNKPHDANDVIQEFVEYFDAHPEENNSTIMVVHDREPPLEIKIWRGMKYHELREAYINATNNRWVEETVRELSRRTKEQPHDKG